MPSITAHRRTAGWSRHITDPAARHIPARWHHATLVSIKAFHTVVFASIAATIVLFVWDGVRGRPGRRTALALGVAAAEAGVYISNNQVCPLTPLAEEFGADSGSVVDIFLPDAAAKRIPVVSSLALLAGIGLNIRAVMRQHRR